MAVHITTDMLSEFNKQNFTKKRCTDLKTKKKQPAFQQDSQEPSDQTISLDPPHLLWVKGFICDNDYLIMYIQHFSTKE